MKTKLAVLLSLLIAAAFAAACFLLTLQETGPRVVTRWAAEERIMTGADDPAYTRAELLPGDRLDINSAGLGELILLPEIGAALAESILRCREENGPFERPEDILRAEGMSQWRFELIREWICVGDLE